MDLICLNGRFFPSDQALFTLQNRSFKYGDGLFETMKVHNGVILLGGLHFERLFSGMNLLKLNKESVTEVDKLQKEILELCNKNNCTELARVRLAVYRSEPNTEYAIEAIPLSIESNVLNKEGYRIDIFPDARKSQDAISNLKSANYLPYVMGDIYARENTLDDSLLLNVSNHICDASKANVFLIKKKEIYTPALHQGCVAGVMRRFLIDEMKRFDYLVHQTEIDDSDLLEADEIFLTNAIYGIRWVKQFREKIYSNSITKEIYNRVYASV